jgi:hypothetical protein
MGTGQLSALIKQRKRREEMSNEDKENNKRKNRERGRLEETKLRENERDRMIYKKAKEWIINNGCKLVETNKSE